MASLTCIVCGGGPVGELTTPVGPRAYCHACFHGWRTDVPKYAYANTAMCSLGTSAERLKRQIAFFAPFAPAGARILEIGCATGELAEATRAALSPSLYEAIELSPAGDTARNKVDRLHTRTLPELVAAGAVTARFDLILMSHVLEHIENPAAELAAMKGVLAPGGALFLEVPNQSGNRHLPIDDNRSHLHFFSVSSLTRMLAGVGLETTATATDVWLDARYADSLQVMGRPFHLPAWPPTLLSDKAALAGDDTMVVWGAGSLTEEVLATLFDPERIDFFIDRDPGKHGSTLLGRPVRGPGALGSAPRTVLINSIDFAPSIEADIARLSPGVGHRLVRIGDLINDGDALRAP